MEVRVGFSAKPLKKFPKSALRPSGSHFCSACDHLKTSYLAADNFKKILDLDGSTPEPAIRPSDTGQRVPCFDSCQLIKTLMSNVCALSCIISFPVFPS